MELTPDQTGVVQRAANEGVPVGAIARIVQSGFGDIHECLRDALAIGRISAIPKADWPPAMKWEDRSAFASQPATFDVEFHCKRVFKLTNLEVGFMTVLLRHDCADKEKLHGVIESQRFKRYARPDQQSVTDPKMVDVMICKLRKKLRDVDHGVVITTSWGKGYYFEPAVKDHILKLIGGSHGGPAAKRGCHSGNAH